MSTNNNSSSLNVSNGRAKQSAVFKMPVKSFPESFSINLGQNGDKNDCTQTSKSITSSIATTPRSDKSNIITCPSTTPSNQSNSQINGSSIKSSVRRLFSPNSSAKSSLINSPNLSSSNQMISSKKQLQLSTPQSSKQITSFLVTQQISRVNSQSQQAIHSMVATSIASTKVLIDPNPAANTKKNSNEMNTSSLKFDLNSIENSNFNNSVIKGNLKEVGSSFMSNILSTSNDLSDETSTASNSTVSSIGSQFKSEPKIIKKKPISSFEGIGMSQSLIKTGSTSATNRSTPTNSLKKHLHILKSNSKKVLMVSNPSTAPSSSSKSTDKSKTEGEFVSSNLSMPQSVSESSSPINSASSSPIGQHSLLALKINEYEMKIKELNNEIDSTYRNSNESHAKIRDLQLEIERLSRLYDYEIGKQSKYEEKMISLKHIAEEKQIESAAIKYEFRKVQEQKETLAAENQYLKSFLNSLNINPQSGTSNNLQVIAMTNSSRHSSPSSAYNSPRLKNNSSLTSVNPKPSTPISPQIGSNNITSSHQIQGNSYTYPKHFINFKILFFM